MLALIKIFLSFHLVKGYSMSPILLEQDWIINNKLAYGIRLNNKDAYIILWNTPKKTKWYSLKTL
nr:S26 family signal peptidase [Borrelia miyamotoi]